MEYNNLLELIKTVSESNISGFQYEDGDTKIMIATGEHVLPGSASNTSTNPGAIVNNVSGGVGAEGNVSVVQANNVTVNTVPEKQSCGNIVKSPLVGTFYAAPAEDAEVFVQVGDAVKKGQTLAIVEAMKLMNDIEAEYEGTILEVFVKNGDIVEYGQPLFAIG